MLRGGKALSFQQSPRHCQTHEVPLTAGINTPGRGSTEKGTQEGTSLRALRRARPSPLQRDPWALRSLSPRLRAGPRRLRPGEPPTALSPSPPSPTGHSPPHAHGHNGARALRGVGGGGEGGGARKRNCARPPLLPPSLFLSLSPPSPPSLPLSLPPQLARHFTSGAAAPRYQPS